MTVVTVAFTSMGYAANEQYAFVVLEKKQVRILISADAKNEADDDFAIVHALLTPSFKVEGLLSAQYSRTAPYFGIDASETSTKSYEEIQRVLKYMDMKVPVALGSQQALKTQPKQDVSAAAQMIVDEANKKSDLPLYVLVMGPITDVALAYQADPSIADKITVLWIGGSPYPAGGWEYNMYNDPTAAKIVFNSEIPLWQIPHNVYMTMRTSMAELQHKVKPQGAIGEYLWKQMIEFNDFASKQLEDTSWPKSEVWVLGDNPSISLLLATEVYDYTMQPAPLLDTETLDYLENPKKPREIRVYNSADARFTLEDFFSKLALFNEKK
ncbi:nucleoside hydrolase [Marinomonas sp. FW-1]|uniref:nucleoside hydrolase n=1 Tax=Marinomonas sp. FW-1 TaxID=2071621 RepID=UPI001C2FA662|nr:nucleoside hydrolase [Marinomonas sp. FW-1]